MLKTYSIVFHPSPAVIDYIKTLKDQLKNKIEWYNSCNSVAHITICEFEIDETEIEKIKDKLLKICNTFTPFMVYLNDFGYYKTTGAFFIDPDEDLPKQTRPNIKKTQSPLKKSIKKENEVKIKSKNKTKLKAIMKKTQDALQLPKLKKSNAPHITIGRRLTQEKLIIASQLFTHINVDYLCDSITMREFDPVKKQFFVIDSFPFGSNPEPELIQGSLF